MNNNEFDTSAEWDKIPIIDGKNLNAKPIPWEEQCPYCGIDIQITDDIFPPDDYIGIEKLTKYISRLYRKCPNCGNIFYEDLGEESDYKYY